MTTTTLDYKYFPRGKNLAISVSCGSRQEVQCLVINFVAVAVPLFFFFAVYRLGKNNDGTCGTTHERKFWAVCCLKIYLTAARADSHEMMATDFCPSFLFIVETVTEGIKCLSMDAVS